MPGSTAVPRRNVMLLPYDENGRLLPEEELGALGGYLRRNDVRRRLLARTCARHKPWYAFHDALVLPEILRPKILFKDIGARPQFWVDWTGDIVPRHSVYYLVPRDAHALPVLLSYLESPAAHEWLNENCQRAAQRLHAPAEPRAAADASARVGGARARGAARAAAERAAALPVSLASIDPRRKEKAMLEAVPR